MSMSELEKEKEVEWLSCQKHLETRLKNIKKVFLETMILSDWATIRVFPNNKYI